jgi:chromosome segregation ATPase
MSSIFNLGSGLFRARNAQRDRDSDLARMESVRRAILVAIEDARREHDGLKRRVNIFYAKAGSLMAETGEYRERVPEDEAELRETERHIDAAQARLGVIEGEIRRLENLLDLTGVQPVVDVA